MRASCRLGVIVAGLVVAASLAASAGPASGDEQIRVTVSASPFSHVAAEGAWAQRAVALYNGGRQPRLAKVIYTARQRTGGQIDYTRTVAVPAGCRRTLQLPVRFGITEITDRPTMRGRSPEPVFNRETYVLWDAQAGRPITQDFAMVYGLRQRDTALAVIGRGDSANDGYSYLGNLPKRQLGNVKLASAISTEQLPDRWYGYDMFDIVLARRLDLSRFRASQLGALLEWVGRGGLLVLAGGRDMPEMLQGALGQAAGASAVGMHKAGTLQPAEAGTQPAAPVRLPHPMPMVWLVADGAEVLVKANGQPLLTTKPLGQGTIFCLATPAGALENEALHEVWRHVGQQSRTLPPVQGDSFMALQKKVGKGKDKDIFLPPPCHSVLESLAGRQGPRRTVPAGLLAVLAAVTVALGAILRPRPRGEWIWIILIPLTLLVGAGVYVYAKAQTDPQRLTFVGLISAAGPDTARVQTANAYYSGTRARTITPSAGDGAGLLFPAGRTNTGSPPQQVQFNGVMSLAERKLNANSTYPFYVDTRRRLGTIESKLSFDQEGVTGTVVNRLGLAMSDAVVLSGRRVYHLGPISADGATPVHLTPADRLGPDEFAGSLIRDVLRDELVGKLLARPGPRTRVSHRPVLIGYTSQNPLRPVSEDRLQQQGWCVVVWPLELRPPQPGKRILIPAGFVRLDLEHAGGMPAWDPDHEEFLQAFMETELLLVARLPKGISPLEQTTVHLTVGIRAPDHRLTVAGVQGRGGGSARRIEIRALEGPTGIIKLAIPRAERFRRADAACVISLKVQPKAAKPGAPSAGRPTGWKFLSIDIALEGIVR